MMTKQCDVEEVLSYGLKAQWVLGKNNGQKKKLKI